MLPRRQRMRSKGDMIWPTRVLCRPSPFAARKAWFNDWNLKRHRDEGKRNFYLFFIKNYNRSLTTLEITIAFASMADRQGKINLCLSQFILSWVRYRVATDKFPMSVDQDSPPVLGFK